MSSTETLSPPPPPPHPKTSSKSGKSKMVTLRLSTEALSKFPADKSDSSTSSNASAGAAAVTVDPASSSSVTASEGNTQPGAAAAPASPSAATNGNADGNSNNNLLAPPTVDPLKRKGIPGPKPGMKRNNSQLTIDGIPKPRGKPGPKKKIKVDGVSGSVGPSAIPKLGPKANQGAINAGLRALDRSGKPCRKWQRNGFQLKSFTGFSWNASAWATQKRPAEDFPGDVKSDSSGSSEPAKPNHDSSAVASEKSNSGGDQDTPMPTIAETTSSPAPILV